MVSNAALYNVASIILYCAKTRQSCPHGNAPCYPTHGWWCDACFWALEMALMDEAWSIGMHPEQVDWLFLHDHKQLEPVGEVI